MDGCVGLLGWNGHISIEMWHIYTRFVRIGGTSLNRWAYLYKIYEVQVQAWRGLGELEVWTGLAELGMGIFE